MCINIFDKSHLMACVINKMSILFSGLCRSFKIIIYLFQLDGSILIFNYYAKCTNNVFKMENLLKNLIKYSKNKNVHKLGISISIIQNNFWFYVFDV